MRKLIVVVALFLNIGYLYSQISIRGTVSDSKMKESLPGAVVYLPEIHKGTTSDKNGNFKLENLQSGNFKMIVSLIGYENKVIYLKTDTLKNPVRIFLKPQIFETQEVIVSANRYSLQHENVVEIKSVNIANTDNLGTNLIEKLAYEPGVDMISKSPGVEKPVIRGLSNTNILFVDNGIRLENFQFSEDHPYMVDEFGIDRTEIIKGPASLLYGSDAVGGVIYTVREKPALQNTLSGDYNLLYFSNNEGWISNFGIKGANKRLHAGIRAGFNSQKDYFDGNNVQVKNSRFNQYSVKSNVGFSYKSGKTDIFYEIQKMKLGMTVPPAIALTDNNLRKNEVWYQDLTSNILAVKNKFFAHKLMIDADFSYQSNNRKLQTSDLMSAFNMVNMTLNSAGYNIKSTYSASKKAELISGVQGMYQKNKNGEAPSHVIPDANIFDFSLYGLLSINFSDGFHFQAGLRYDYRNIATVAEENKPAVNKPYNNLSFSSGLNYQFSKVFQVRANFASAQRTPNIAELSQNGVHGIYYQIGNSDMKTQVNYEPDVSFHLHLDEFIFETSAFYNYINDYIYLQRTSDYTDNGMPIYQYEQMNASIKGLEGGIKYMPVKFLKVYANFSSLIAKKSDGENLPFIPQNKIRSEIKFIKEKISVFDKIYLSLNGVYAFKQNNFAPLETVTPEYFVIDAGAGFFYKLKNNQFDFKISAKNLFNEKYLDHLSTLKGTGLLMPGRNIVFSIKYIF